MVFESPNVGDKPDISFGIRCFTEDYGTAVGLYYATKWTFSKERRENNDFWKSYVRFNIANEMGITNDYRLSKMPK